MNLFLKKLSFILLIVMVFHSCANYKLNYTADAKTWTSAKPMGAQAVRHSIYLIGDTGYGEKGETVPHYKYLKKELDNASADNSIIFLGNNVSPEGMPPKSHQDERELAESKIDAQLDVVANFKGNVMYIPGDTDWNEYGLKGLKRQQRYVEKSLNKQRNGTDDDDDDNWEDFYLPGGGCGDPQVIEINDQLVVVVIDSEWWLRDWNSDQSINDGCEIKTRAGFYREFENIVRKHRNSNVVIAMHHPLYSNGRHGGHFTFGEHLFPLRSLNKDLYVPLPGIGSALAFYRGAVGINQDLATSKFSEMREDILAAIGKNGSYIVASGHDNNLQYLNKDDQHYIISGSGSKEDAAAVGSGGEFSYAKLGYSRLDFYEDGTTWLHFLALNENGDGMEEVYRKKIKDKLNISKSNIPTSFPEYDKGETVKLRKPTNFEFDKVGSVHRGILGAHYSDIYLQEYKFDVLDLSAYRGGMSPLQRGGGNQTNSLRLADTEGRQFALRALTKDASRALPYPINQIAAARDLLQDNFMAAYPFAALMVTDMAEAANIYHTNPQLYYMPKQPALGYQNDLFGGDVYLLEERPGGDWSDLASFGNSDKIISTLDVIEKITKSRKHRVDQEWVVRSRIFDLLIKDWDRHEDQWRWATFEDEKGKFYRPIPRDRDQAFAKYDGAIAFVSAAVNPFMRQLQTFTPDVSNIKWESWNSTYFDQTFLGELEWEDWEKEALYIQKNVTDEVIELAFGRIPDSAKDEDWKQMLADIKKRRDAIVDFARMSYELKSKVVDVLGTNKRDLFEVDRISDTQTSVKVYELSKKGVKKDLAYERIFDHDVTKEVHLYGMADDDVFNISGTVSKSLKVRIVGGVDDDKLVDNSKVSSLGKKTLYYDSSLEDNEIELGKEAKNKSSKKVALNTYDRRSFHYNPDYWIPLPVLEFFPDDGLIIGVEPTFYHHQFKKDPYAQKHHFRLSYSAGSTAINFLYNGEYTEAVGPFDLLTNANLRGSRYAFNYFGTGNETVNPDPDDLDFNRVRQSQIYTDVLLRKRFANDNGSFTFGSFIEHTGIDDTAERFITETDVNLPADVFEERIYTGGKVKFGYENLDHKVNPQKGVKFHIGYDVETTIDGPERTFGKLKTGLTIYQGLDKKGNITLASQANFQTINGTYDFFKAPAIGGRTNLRGFRAERFRGDSSFGHSTDLRVKLGNSKNKVLPFSFGLHGGFDYGRVWEEGVDSDEWHTSTGGGIWLDPIDFLVISLGYYVSDEDERILFKLAHMF